MKILHASRETKAESRYGMGRANAQLLSGLNQIGIRADFLCSSDLRAAPSEQAKHWSKWIETLLPKDLRSLYPVMENAWLVGRVAAQKAIDEGYTHLHCHDAIVAAGAKSILQDSDIAWGVSQHGFHSVAQALHLYVQPLPLGLRGLLWNWERSILSAADWIVCPTQLGCLQLAKELRLLMDVRWQAIPHAVPEFALVDKSAARQSLGWDNSLRYILAVGQLIPLKRFDLVIQAMTRLPENWRLVILGDGDPAPYIKQASQLKVSAPLIASTDDVGIYLAAADIFVSASSTESFGMAILEAMAAGLPVVCTPVGGVIEVAANAAMYTVVDGSDLGERLVDLLADPRLCSRFASRSKTRASNWPDLLTIAKRYYAMYNAWPQKQGSRLR